MKKFTEAETFRICLWVICVHTIYTSTGDRVGKWYDHFFGKCYGMFGKKIYPVAVWDIQVTGISITSSYLTSYIILAFQE